MRFPSSRELASPSLRDGAVQCDEGTMTYQPGERPGLPCRPLAASLIRALRRRCVADARALGDGRSHNSLALLDTVAGRQGCRVADESPQSSFPIPGGGARSPPLAASVLYAAPFLQILSPFSGPVGTADRPHSLTASAVAFSVSFTGAPEAALGRLRLAPPRGQHVYIQPVGAVRLAMRWEVPRGTTGGSRGCISTSYIW